MNRLFFTVVMILFLAGLTLMVQAADIEADLEAISDPVVAKYVTDKHIPGLSVTIVYDGVVAFSKAYGKERLSPDIPASPQSAYPISSVSRIFAGPVTLKLVEKNLINLDDSIAIHLEDTPKDKHGITIRQLLGHTHGLTDFYHSADFEKDTGLASKNAPSSQLIEWSMNQPLSAEPGTVWAYGVIGYAVLGKVLEMASGLTYVELVQREIFKPLGINAYYGNSQSPMGDHVPMLYEYADGKVIEHPVDFRPFVYPAAGLNISSEELAKLFVALDGEQFLSAEQKQQLWKEVPLQDGKNAYYGLGWFSYISSQNRWVVGHEGGGASWVVHYPNHRLTVIALSNMSGARADALPFDIARAAFDAGLF